jgi:hypothetical protein
MWYKQLIQKLNRIKYAWVVDSWEMNLADACNAYGGCPFVKLCDSPEPENWIEGNFIHRKWEPLKVVV